MCFRFNKLYLNLNLVPFNVIYQNKIYLVYQILSLFGNKCVCGLSYDI